MPKQEHNIELQCIICPKRPRFSDVSHLLTHIASKSHLSAKFKIELQSKSDQDAKDTLDLFELWYSTYDIGTLLQERMAMKDTKTKKSRKSTVPSNVPVRPSFTLSSAQLLIIGC